jgi:hypothetical protein
MVMTLSVTSMSWDRTKEEDYHHCWYCDFFPPFIINNSFFHHESSSIELCHRERNTIQIEIFLIQRKHFTATCRFRQSQVQRSCLAFRQCKRVVTLYFHEAKRYLSGLMKLELVARGSHDPTNSNEDSHASIYIYIDHVNRVVVPSGHVKVSSFHRAILSFEDLHQN